MKRQLANDRVALGGCLTLLLVIGGMILLLSPWLLWIWEVKP